MIVYIVGFMGAGKSSLADFWRHEFPGKTKDLDHIISQRVGCRPDKLGDWIQKVGFTQFRLEESKALSDLCSEFKKGHLLLSLGGGAFHPENRKILEESNSHQGIWVETPVEICWDRVSGDSNRPLVAEGKEAFYKLYESRLADYEQAKYRLSGDSEWPKLREFCKKYKVQGLMD